MICSLLFYRHIFPKLPMEIVLLHLASSKQTTNIPWTIPSTCIPPIQYAMLTFWKSSPLFKIFHHVYYLSLWPIPLHGIVCIFPLITNWVLPTTLFARSKILVIKISINYIVQFLINILNNLISWMSIMTIKGEEEK